MVEEMASKVKQYSHTRRWIVGTLTNSLRVNQIPVRPPDALIFLNTMTSILKPHYAIIEAGKMAIPTVGIVDSNSSMFCSVVASYMGKGEVSPPHRASSRDFIEQKWSIE